MYRENMNKFIKEHQLIMDFFSTSSRIKFSQAEIRYTFNTKHVRCYGFPFYQRHGRALTVPSGLLVSRPLPKAGGT